MNSWLVAGFCIFIAIRPNSSANFERGYHMDTSFSRLYFNSSHYMDLKFLNVPVQNDVNSYTDIFSQTLKSSQSNKKFNNEKDYSDTLESLLLIDSFLADQKEKLYSKENTYSPQLLSVNQQAKQNCSVDFETFLAAVTNRSRWALEMVDAIGKPGSGIGRQSPPFPAIGNYDECMAVDTGLHFDTQYCTTVFWISKIGNNVLKQPVVFYLGLCMPDSCDTREIEKALNTLLQSNIAVTAGVTQTTCQERHPELSTKAFVVICICALFTTLLVVGTAYDVIYVRWVSNNRAMSASMRMDDKLSNGEVTNATGHHRSEYEPLIDPQVRKKSYAGIKPGVGRQLLLSFSVYTNAGKLFSTNQSKDSIGSINGIRFISMTWVILGHTYVMGLRVMENSLPYLEMSNKRWTFQVITNALVSVDTFFTLSGLLLTYLVLKELDRKSATPNFFGNFYFHRFWRLTPPYMLVLMTYVPLFKYISDGPIWPQGGIEVDECKDTWWTNLLYVNNFVRTDKMCMGWSWYLANDMQFYIISPIIFLPIFYFGIIGLIAPLCFLLATAITAGVITNLNHLDPNINILQSAGNDYFEVYYIKPYTRMGPYVVGMITGYLLHRCECKARLSKAAVILGWTAATGIALAVQYGLYDESGVVDLPNDVNSLYNSLHRIAWGVCVSWVIFACANGYGGFVNTLLSWKALIPLSRLTYCAYLVHPLVIMFFYYSQRQLFYLDNINVSYAFLGTLTLSYAVAFVASMAYEAPMMGLEKALKGQGKKQPVKS